MCFWPCLPSTNYFICMCSNGMTVKREKSALKRTGHIVNDNKSLFPVGQCTDMGEQKCIRYGLKDWSLEG